MKGRRLIDWQALRRWRPCHADGLEWEERDGLVVIKMTRRDWRGKLVQWLTGKPVRRKIELDEIGSFVWRLCDGDHTLTDIVESLVNRYKLLRREAIASLTQFLMQLHRRGLLEWRGEKGK